MELIFPNKKIQSSELIWITNNNKKHTQGNLYMSDEKFTLNYGLLKIFKLRFTKINGGIKIPHVGQSILTQFLIHEYFIYSPHVWYPRLKKHMARIFISYHITDKQAHDLYKAHLLHRQYPINLSLPTWLKNAKIFPTIAGIYPYITEENNIGIKALDFNPADSKIWHDILKLYFIQRFNMKLYISVTTEWDMSYPLFSFIFRGKLLGVEKITSASYNGKILISYINEIWNKIKYDLLAIYNRGVVDIFIKYYSFDIVNIRPLLKTHNPTPCFKWDRDRKILAGIGAPELRIYTPDKIECYPLEGNVPF